MNQEAKDPIFFTPIKFNENLYAEMVRPCRNGHLSVRYKSNGACWACQDARRKKYRETEKGASKERASRRKSYQDRRCEMQEKARQWNAANPGSAAKASKNWRENNKEKQRSYSYRYVRENKDRKACLSALYTKRKEKATPAWADLEKISDFYRLANSLTVETGIKHEVDHVIPIKGKNVCGLHVHENLQVITERDNRIKYNKAPES